MLCRAQTVDCCAGGRVFCGRVQQIRPLGRGGAAEHGRNDLGQAQRHRHVPKFLRQSPGLWVLARLGVHDTVQLQREGLFIYKQCRADSSGDRPRRSANFGASAANHDWQWDNNYFCVTPFYVQFRPDASGKVWNWPGRIDTWLYSLPTNLLFGLPPLAASGTKFSTAERAQMNASIAGSFRHYQNIQASHSSSNCPGKDSGNRK